MPSERFHEALTFDDVLLVPGRSDVQIPVEEQLVVEFCSR